MSGSDRQLVRQSLAGEREAFDLLYQRHAPRVFHFLRRLTGGEADAEDLTQETFLAAYGALAGWREEGAFGTWLCGIAFRQYAAARRQRRLVTEPLDEASEPAALAPGLDPLAHCLRQEQLERIEAALAALPPLAREVFVLVKVEGFSYRDAAAWLNVPLGTVQSRLWRAVCALQRALAEPAEPAEAGRSGVRHSGVQAPWDRTEPSDRSDPPSLSPERPNA